VNEARERARKVRPQYAEGPVVRVATARNQAEAELIQGILLEEGVPSLVRRTGGFDVPDFLASGPRDILVPASGESAARDILRTQDPRDAQPERDIWHGVDLAAPQEATGAPPWVRALAVTLAVLILALVAAGVYAAITG
jgi:hypothetical protein